MATRKTSTKKSPSKKRTSGAQPATLTLRAHPRLFISAKHRANLQRPPQLPFLQQAAADVKQQASRALTETLTYRDGHNTLLIRARRVQTRVINWLVRWEQTKQAKYKQAVIDVIQEMHDYDYWSWFNWLEKDPDPTSTFDLSYGENSATLAIAYDWLYQDLSSSERQLCIDCAEKWSFASGLVHCKPDGLWWYKQKDCNWNTVCAGGLGMLCLAMYEDSAAARTLLPNCDESVTPFMLFLNETEGAWPEGAGYWNYGMRYAFYYLLSMQRATQKKHPLLSQRGVKQTLRFPPDFTPNNIACSFGDCNTWAPMPFHYRIADELGEGEVLAQIDSNSDAFTSSENWPNQALWLLFHKDVLSTASSAPVTKPYARIYKGMDWAILADQSSNSQMYLAVRGGSTRVPHSHRDLLSFYCVIGNEALIGQATGHEYLDSTFSQRREELYEIGPQSKNTLLINGLGILPESELDSTELIKKNGLHGLRLIATTAMGEKTAGSCADFCGRLFIMLGELGYLIIDRVDLPQIGRVENRLHSYADLSLRKDGATLRGKKQRLNIRYAASEEAVFATALSAPTNPNFTPMQVLRWGSKGQHKSITFATLLSHGGARSSVSLHVGRQDGKAGIHIHAQIGDQEFKLRCSHKLHLQ